MSTFMFSPNYLNICQFLYLPNPTTEIYTSFKGRRRVELGENNQHTSSIRRLGSNPRPLGCESSALTTRPRLLAKNLKGFSFSWTQVTWKSDWICNHRQYNFYPALKPIPIPDPPSRFPFWYQYHSRLNTITLTVI